MSIIFIIFLSVLSFYFLAKACHEWRRFFAGLTFSSGLDEVEEESVELPPEAVGFRYDVNAFTQRMEKLRQSMDADGLFDIESSPPQVELTGTEVIDGQMEMELERYGR